jgi:hypothetical protein
MRQRMIVHDNVNDDKTATAMVLMISIMTSMIMMIMVIMIILTLSIKMLIIVQIIIPRIALYIWHAQKMKSAS